MLAWHNKWVIKLSIQGEHKCIYMGTCKIVPNVNWWWDSSGLFFCFFFYFYLIFRLYHTIINKIKEFGTLHLHNYLHWELFIIFISTNFPLRKKTPNMYSESVEVPRDKPCNGCQTNTKHVCLYVYVCACMCMCVTPIVLLHSFSLPYSISLYE